MRPFIIFRYFVRAGCSMSRSPGGSRSLRPGAAGGARSARAGGLRQDLAAHDPDLAADLAVGRLGLGEPVVDVRAERVEGHAPLAVPLVPRHLGAAEAARAGHADALGAELLRRL